MTINQPSSISRRIAACFEAFAKKDYESALVHFFPALDKTAKRRRPKDGVGQRIRKFIVDQEVIISSIATGNIIKNIRINGLSFPEAIYKFGCTSIAHEGELDKRLQITDSNTLSIGAVWSLPSSYISAMCIAVMVAPENTCERLIGDGTIRLFDQEWHLNELWGAESRLKTAITMAFNGKDLLAHKASTFNTFEIPSINRKVEQLLYESSVSRVTWEEIETIKIVPWLPIGIQHYFLIFKADIGSIRGRIRVKGSKDLYSFSTNANDKMPLTIHNLWIPDTNQYQHFPVIEHQART